MPEPTNDSHAVLVDFDRGEASQAMCGESGSSHEHRRHEQAVSASLNDAVGVQVASNSTACDQRDLAQGWPQSLTKCFRSKRGSRSDGTDIQRDDGLDRQVLTCGQPMRLTCGLADPLPVAIVKTDQRGWPMETCVTEVRNASTECADSVANDEARIMLFDNRIE